MKYYKANIDCGHDHEVTLEADTLEELAAETRDFFFRADLDSDMINVATEIDVRTKKIYDRDVTKELKEMVDAEPLSACCAAPFYEETDICKECKEHG